jgi:hypothetical protein
MIQGIATASTLIVVGFLCLQYLNYGRFIRTCKVKVGRAYKYNPKSGSPFERTTVVSVVDIKEGWVKYVNGRITSTCKVKQFEFSFTEVLDDS